MSHVESRLQMRDLPYTESQLADIASQYTVDTVDTAVILGKRVSEEGVRFGYVLIILIVRGRRPVTVMTRRQSQNFDKRNFGVQQVKYL